MEVFIEPIESAPTLVLFGAGHVAQPLARIAKSVGFRVEVVDDRVKFANRERFPDADLVLVDDLAGAAGQLTLGRSSYAVVVTRGHHGDTEALRCCLARELRFVGLLASRPKFVHIATALAESGVPPERVASIRAPLGLNIGATTPDEIAVSILAEMIAVRHGIAASEIGSMRLELPGRFKVAR